MTKIYESPDNGLTVYERTLGDYSTRKLVDSDWSQSQHVNSWSIRNTVWIEVIEAAKNNSEIAEYLNRALVLYQLGKND